MEGTVFSSITSQFLLLLLSSIICVSFSHLYNGDMITKIECDDWYGSDL